MAVRLPDPRRSRIVLIGASTYTAPELPDLPSVHRTIEDLAGLLTDQYYGVVPEEHCTVLLDEGDLRTIGQRLRTTIREAEDLLLVYYAGHGLVSGRRHELYLALPDSDWDDPEFSSLEYEKLRSAVLDSPAATKVIILDCCFSGRVVTDTMAGGEAAELGQIEVAGTYVLTSAQRDQVALALPGEHHTAFSGRLMRLLAEGVVGGPELLTVDDLYQRLKATMAAEGLSTPLNRGTQTASNIGLGVNRAFAATIGPQLRQQHIAAVEQGKSGDWPGASAILQKIADEQTRILGAEHTDTLRTRQSYAHSLGGAGGPVEAAQLLRQLLPEQLRLLGPDHEDTLRTRQFLAVNLGEAGFRDEAVGMLRILLADRGRVLGPDSPHTLRTRHMLARNLALTGATDEAMALLRQLEQERERLLGAEHPHTLRARDDLAALTVQER
ncbi:tetratricopeptide repeat protein [Streptomyces sp. RKAG293]|uniref:caspase, EACC1-associated type n=1 Tax=Streptomyces sp. RKAG293 TaxID=2893403 RepID=UPI002034624A|nr:tetratricopeptide repeat protein [Streptomyces sp. RKAG293]MCM2422116.1 caspase family protein [Streptomyces sp. RKAG293]